MKKKICFIVISIMLLSTLCIQSFAVDPRLMPVTTVYGKEDKISAVVQKTDYWCGPASVYQTLAYHKKTGSNITASVPSQSTLSTKIGTTTDGSNTVAMCNALNSYSGSFGFSSKQYNTSNITDKNSPDEWLFSALKNSLQNGKAPIILVQTGTIDGLNQYYVNGKKSVRHYVTVGCVKETVDANTNAVVSRMVQYADSNNVLTYNGVYWDTFAHVYGSVHLADSNGANKVVIY